MQRIEQTFARLRAARRAALIPYLTAGDPNLEATEALVPVAEAAGADLLELGVPFSDPLADGATIQRASQRALAQGVTLRKILHLVARLRRSTELPLILMTYYNPVLRAGPAGFAAEAAAAGVDGVIVPDLPPEEAGALREAARAAGVAPIFLAAPTSTDARLRLICGASEGYIYYVSLRGVTGARAALPADLASQIARLRARTTKPIAVGFGISTPAQARAVAGVADGVIVGSALVGLIERSSRGEGLPSTVSGFLRELRAGMDPG
jgi:tryptophan synthase alpha chain